MTLPGSLGGMVPGDDASLARRLRDLERQVAELRTARSIDASTISPGGTLLVADKDNHIVAAIGQAFGDTTDPGVAFWRKDGSAALQVTAEFVGVFDKQGTPVFSDDYKAGWGIATPHLGGGLVMADTNTSRWPQTT